MSTGTIRVGLLEEGTEEKYHPFRQRCLQNCTYSRSVFIKINHAIKFLEQGVQSKVVNVSCNYY